MEEESPVFRDPQLERQKSRDKTRDPVDLADFYLAELAGGTSSSVSKLDLQNGNHAAATLCLQGYVEDRLASLGQDKLDISSGTDSGTGDSLEDPAEIHTDVITTPHDVITTPHDVITTPHGVITTPHDVIKAPRENVLHPQEHAPQNRPSANRVGFKTHVPGIFDKIQAKLDSSVKLIDDELQESRRPRKTSKSPETFSNSAKSPETFTRSNSALSRSSSVLSSDDPIEIADQCLAEFQSDLIAPRDVITTPRDVITPPRDVITPPREIEEVPPLHENIKHLPPKMTKTKSVPSMQRNARGFKTHVPGIFDKIQARLDSSVKLIDEEESTLANKSTRKFSNETETRRNKPAQISRSSSVLSSDDPIEIADQCLAEFQSDLIAPRDVITPPRDVITPPRDVITPPREFEVPPLHENIKHLPPKMTKAKSVPSMQRNTRGFKTHVPGIFDKIQARLDSSVKLIDDEVTEELSSKNRSRQKTTNFANKTEVDKVSKPALLSRSSSILSSDDPVEIADQCLAEFQDSAPLSPPRHEITPPIEVIQHSRDVITTPRDVITPPRDVITTPREFEVPPLHENIKHLPPKMTKTKSVPSMQRNARGFKTHVPGIFDKIQARLDSSVKLIDEEEMEENSRKIPRDVIEEKLKNLEPDGFQCHVPDVFNKIQEKLYFSPDVKENQENEEKQVLKT